MANPIDKEMYIYCEFCKKRMLNCDIAAKIKEMGFSKERIRADCAEPKSNDDLRRLGIGRITPSVKGRDSILNGISAINEYRITVNPDCTDMSMKTGQGKTALKTRRTAITIYATPCVTPLRT